MRGAARIILEPVKLRLVEDMQHLRLSLLRAGLSPEQVLKLGLPVGATLNESLESIFSAVAVDTSEEIVALVSNVSRFRLGSMVSKQLCHMPNSSAAASPEGGMQPEVQDDQGQ